MPRNLKARFGWVGFMSQQDSVNGSLMARHAARHGGGGVMVARDPCPSPTGCEAQKVGLDMRGKTMRTVVVVETVAKTPDFRRVDQIDQRGQIVQRRRAVIRREHLAAVGEPTRLLKMQVGNDERAPLSPEEGTLREQDHVLPCKLDPARIHSRAMAGLRAAFNLRPRGA